jgi:hypothetical protein
MEQIVKNKDVYEPDVEKYYLRYRERDLQKPYAKHWHPLVAPISDEAQRGLTSSPWPSVLGIYHSTNICLDRSRADQDDTRVSCQ